MAQFTKQGARKVRATGPAAIGWNKAGGSPGVYSVATMTTDGADSAYRLTMSPEEAARLAAMVADHDAPALASALTTSGRDALAAALAGVTVDALDMWTADNARTARNGRTAAYRAFYHGRASAFAWTAATLAGEPVDKGERRDLARGHVGAGTTAARDADRQIQGLAEELEDARSDLAAAHAERNARTEERDENNAAAVAEEARAERLAAALLDVAALLRVAMSPRATLDRGQAAAAIVAAGDALGVHIPPAHARDGDSV